jgi:hypothetical protein
VKRVQVMSGFRTPRYNKSGGNTGGRANLSRHMYGDASDIFVDNDGNGTMDDLNRDGGWTPPTPRSSPTPRSAWRPDIPPWWAGSGSTAPAAGTGPSPTSTPAVPRPLERRHGRIGDQGGVVTETLCPECGSERTDFTKVCPACGAPPASEHRQGDSPGGVRGHDLEPYITLRYIAKLFKVLAVLIIVMLAGEVVTGSSSTGPPRW